MSWLRRRRPKTPVRAVGRARLGDNDVIPLDGFRRYADLLRPALDDSPLMTPGQAARSAPAVDNTEYRPCHDDTDRGGWR